MREATKHKQQNRTSKHLKTKSQINYRNITNKRERKNEMHLLEQVKDVTSCSLQVEQELKSDFSERSGDAHIMIAVEDVVNRNFERERESVEHSEFEGFG
jgi:hypothetical protein